MLATLSGGSRFLYICSRFTVKLQVNHPSPALKLWGLAVRASRMMPYQLEEVFGVDSTVVLESKSICFDVLAMCPAKRVRPQTGSELVLPDLCG